VPTTTGVVHALVTKIVYVVVELSSAVATIVIVFPPSDKRIDPDAAPEAFATVLIVAVSPVPVNVAVTVVAVTPLATVAV
jgi:hypothetical protein